MNNLLSTTSPVAIYAAMGHKRAQVASGVSLTLLYNPFEPDTAEKHELDWFDGVTLNDYVGDLDAEVEWLIFLNGHVVDPVTQADIKVTEGSHLGVVVVPQGNAVKSILKVLIVVAAVIGALYLVGPWTIGGIIAVGAAGASVGLMLANLLVRPKFDAGSNDSDGSSYGIDGAKNSATEGIPYPVVYGEFRCAGNFADVYSENAGDDQYLYLRSVLNDGEFESVTDIEFNEQPMASFSDVSHQVYSGTLDQALSPWFNRSISQRNKNVRLTQTWVSHITEQPVDVIRLDLMFPGGLVNIDEKKGTKRSQQVGFEVRYRKLDPVTKQPITAWGGVPNGGNVTTYNLNSPGMGGLFVNGVKMVIAKRAGAQVPNQTPENPLSGKIRYRKVGSPTWINVPQVPVAFDNSKYVYDPSGDGSISGETDISPIYSYVYDFNFELDPGEYEFEALDGSVIQKVVSYGSGLTTGFVVTDNRTKQLRRSFETARVDRGFYEIGIRRQTAPSTDDYIIDDVYLTDVGEIDIDDIRLAGTANLAVRIRLNEQLNQIPTVTGKVRGCILQEYDEEGSPTVRRWSANPAWIGLDILLNPARGAGVPSWRIDWPAWIDFAKHCDDNNIFFNGVFDQDGNIGDALRQVLRIGQAVPVPFGTRISVAIDRMRSPVGAFNSTSIIDGTFEVQYLPMADRANDFEVSYFDKNDKNKQKSIRFVDQKAVTFNELPRKAEMTLVGVDNADQAKRELWKAIYSNRLLIRTITFDAFMEAISANIGDVLLISHPMMQWSEDGRLESGSTQSVLKLDRLVDFDTFADYSVIVLFDAIELAQLQVSNVVGNRIFVPTSTLSNESTRKKVRRVTLGSNQDIDYAVSSIEKGTTFDTVLLEQAPIGITTGSTVKFWNTDVVEERDVTSANVVDGKTVLTLSAPLPLAPGRHKPFIYGRKEIIQRPYVLNGISGSGIERRKLTFIEYHEGVYSAPELDIPTPTSRTSDTYVDHVQGLLMDYERLVAAGRNVSNVRVHWSTGRNTTYAGADVYVSVNGETHRSIGAISDALETTFQASVGDVVSFIVVAYNKKGYRAPIDTAPSVSGTVVIVEAVLDDPLNLNAVSAAFQADGKIDISWSAPADATGIVDYEVQYRQTGSLTWISAGYHAATRTEIAGLTTGDYEIRVRASGANTATSQWVYDSVAVVVTPGSLMANWLSSNDRNGSPIGAPTLPATGVIEHTLNTDSSANVSFEWLWNGDESEIDGFVITMEQTP